MKNMHSKIIPYRIKQARVSRGFSMIELASRVGISKQSISQYEMGTATPSPLILRNISEVLNYNLSFFTKPMPTTNSSNSAIFFRKKRGTRTKVINAAKEKIEIFREISDYLSEFVDFPQINIPTINYNCDYDELLDNETIEEYALMVREKWGLGYGPIGNLTMELQKNGFFISKMNFGDSKLDAFSVWYNNKPYIFLSNDKPSNARIRFDIAHELGHLLMHANFYTEDEIKASPELYKKIENEADRFAGALLMPNKTFREDIYSTSIEHFINLKQKWLTSIGSMIYRCETIGILNFSQVKYLKDQMTARIYWRKEPLDNTIPIETPFALKQAVNLLLDNNIVDTKQIVESIGCHSSEIEEYCFLQKGTLSFNNYNDTVKLKSSNIIDFNDYI